MKNQDTVPYWMSRTSLMLDEATVLKLMKKNVLVVGLGGVGGMCAEMIARAGIGKMTIVDADIVDDSNRNRQVPALVSTSGKLKAEVMGNRIKDINPDIKLTIIAEYIKDQRMIDILNSEPFDYVVDCIDTLTPKVYLIKHSLDLGLKIVSSMGAGGKKDPTQVKIDDISKSFNCKLAYYTRKRLHRLGIYKGLKVVFSTEQADKSKVIEVEEGPKKSIIGTVPFLPAIFGCFLASVVINDLSNC